jgi:hypothetical protein
VPDADDGLDYMEGAPMLWRSSSLEGYAIHAIDDRIGSVSDLLFDDRDWTVRWLVVDTGDWLPGRKVLLPPSALGHPDEVTRELPVDLTRRQVEDSPDIDTDAPVSRQKESDVYMHYGWTPYWMPTYVAPIGEASTLPPGQTSDTGAGAQTMATVGGPAPAPAHGDPQLRSMHHVRGYHVGASDGDIGHIEDLLVEDGSWTVRWLVIDTRNWWPGKKVLVAPDWAQSISWHERKIIVGCSRSQVEHSPEFHADMTVDRQYEERLSEYYGKRPYWI